MSTAYLMSKQANLGDSASSILRPPGRRRPRRRPDPGQPAGPSTVVLHIPAGTGGNPWKTPRQAGLAAVGDTLRVVNDESPPHGRRPFPHQQSAIAPGQSVDFLLRTPFDSAPPNHPLYDHNFVDAAAFWIKVTAAH